MANLAFTCLLIALLGHEASAASVVTLEATALTEVDHVSALSPNTVNGGATVGGTLKITGADGAVSRAHLDIGAMSNRPGSGARLIGSVSWNDSRPMPFVKNPHVRILYPVLGGLNADITPLVAFKAGTVILGAAFTNNVIDTGLILSVGTVGIEGSGVTSFLGRQADRQTGLMASGVFPSLYFRGNLSKRVSLDARAEVGVLGTSPLAPETVATSPTTARQIAPGVASGTELYVNADVGVRYTVGEHSVRLGVGAEAVDIEAAQKNIDGSATGTSVINRSLAGKISLTWTFDVVPAK